MSAIPIDWKPNTRKLREFGIASLICFSAIGFFIAHKVGVFNGSGRWTAPGVLWGLAVCGALGILLPPLIRPLYLVLMAIAMPIGWVMSHVLLGLVFYGLFTPIALFFRLVGRDALQRKIDAKAPTYWEQAPPERKPGDYYRQF